MFLHDAIGVGLFVVIAHHVEKSVDCTRSCSPVDGYIMMANRTLRSSFGRGVLQRHKNMLL